MITLDSFKAALTNPSTIHKSSSLTEAFNEFCEGMKHFFKTGDVKNVRAQKRETEFTHIVQEIKCNLNPDKTWSNDPHILYTNPNKTINIEQRGLNIVVVLIDKDGKTEDEPELLKKFEDKYDMQDFLNGEPLLRAALGNYEAHKLLLSIHYEGQAFLPNLDKIAQAHFDKTPKKDFGFAEGERYNDFKRTQTLAHLLKSHPILLHALQTQEAAAQETLNTAMAAAHSKFNNFEADQDGTSSLVTLAQIKSIFDVAKVLATH